MSIYSTQFIRLNQYSRSPVKRESGQNVSMSAIVAEAEREPLYSRHIESPQPPILLYGVDFYEAQRVAENYCENTPDSNGHKMRKNGLCFLTGVCSMPPDKSKEEWDKYKLEVISFLKEKWGDSLVSVIEHIDEPYMSEPDKIHYHIHFACVPPNGKKFDTIHPGLKAKHEADTARGNRHTTQEERKLGRMAGDKAYKEAMRKFQDEFHSKVCIKYNLNRLGPRRLRLPREAYLKQVEYQRAMQEHFESVSQEQEEKGKLNNFKEEFWGKAEKIIVESQQTKSREISAKIKALNTELITREYDEAGLPEAGTIESASHYKKRFLPDLKRYSERYREQALEKVDGFGQWFNEKSQLIDIIKMNDTRIKELESQVAYYSRLTPQELEEIANQREQQVKSNFSQQILRRTV